MAPRAELEVAVASECSNCTNLTEAYVSPYRDFYSYRFNFDAEQCLAWTECTAMEWQSVTPTRIDDRVCTPLTNCTENEYQAQAQTLTADRVCKPLTICNTTIQYENVSATETDITGVVYSADRICAPLTECGEHGTEVVAPTNFTDRECLCR